MNTDCLMSQNAEDHGCAGTCCPADWKLKQLPGWSYLPGSPSRGDWWARRWARIAFPHYHQYSTSRGHGMAGPAPTVKKSWIFIYFFFNLTSLPLSACHLKMPDGHWRWQSLWSPVSPWCRLFASTSRKAVEVLLLWPNAIFRCLIISTGLFPESQNLW